ncbi:hypothetical protein [Thiomicrorhabdus sp.]|uniref:hypothetical protein n=1 Tax=Thiomicrorhabdus sp. TaxID=2039724 RepID=UPI002AA688FC|nr:hypothetical protein [Thiomicrorhabdus sp.]
MNMNTKSKTLTSVKSLSAVALGYILFSNNASASEMPGKALHDSANCMKCHAAKPYNPQKTDTYEKLVKTVAFCNSNLHIGLFDDEVNEVADYLNATYYHHPK